MKRKLLILFLFFLVLQVNAQNTQLKGTVVDSGGITIAGANVLVTGTKIATATDFDGKFTVSLPANAKTITVSYIGFNDQVVTVANKQQVKITLEESNIALNEVIVVGYGTQKKATLTGAVSTVKGKDLNKRAVASLSLALQGTMPGVTIQQTSGEPGADGANIRIRGIGSYGSSSYPLVLVNGIEMNIDQLDMNTVETISVLKDAASAAIYGSRASNGVILITTKRGNDGVMKLTFDSYVSSQNPTNLPDPVSAADYLQAELDARTNAGQIIPNSERTVLEKIILDQRTLKPDNWNRYDTNWKDATIAKSALLSNHSFTLSGGNKEIKYFAAFSQLNQGGLIENNNFKRTNLRATTDAQITPWLKLSNEISYRTSTQLTPGISSPKGIINKALYMLPTLSAVTELDGNWGYGKNGDNPVANAEASGTSTTVRPELQMSATLTATPVKDLELLAEYSYRKTETRGTYIITPYLTSLKGITNGYYPSIDGVSETWGQNIRNYFRAQASYSKKMGEHNTKLLVGTQTEDNSASDFSASRTGFLLDRYYLNNGDRATASNSGGITEWAIVSFYGRFNYDYKDKYLFEATGRYDGSSRFINDRWGFFPSISAGWTILNEKFMEGTSKYISFLKLRASVGTLGNQDIGTNYPYTATVNPGYSYWLDKQIATGAAQTTQANPVITWESSRQTNFGLDTSFFDRKLSFTFDYYIKDIYDQLIIYPIPYYVGLNPINYNAGDMTNKGWETLLTYKSKVGEFNYSVTATLSNNENKVTKLYGDFPNRELTVGYPAGGLWGYQTDGYYADAADVANSPRLSSSAKPGYVKYVKVDQSGLNPTQITERDKVYLGDPFPHYEYGLNLTANYHNFDATIFIQGVGERKVVLDGIGLRPFFNGSNLFTHQLDTWTPDNPNAAYPILVPEANSSDNFQRSDKWVKDGAYTRLKNVVIGYTIPKANGSKSSFDSVRLYVSAQNLYTISKFYKGYDPEVNYGGSLGGEFYPIMQTYTFGINLKF